MPVPQRSVFTGWMPFLPSNQQRQTTEGRNPEILMKFWWGFPTVGSQYTQGKFD